MPKTVDEGENRILNILFGSTSVDETLYLGLFTNTTEPTETAMLANITEPTGASYSRKAISRGSWTIDGDLASYAQQVFSASESWGDIYGYFIATSSDDSGILMQVEAFSAGAYPIENDGDEIKVTPKIRAS